MAVDLQLKTEYNTNDSLLHFPDTSFDQKFIIRNFASWQSGVLSSFP